MTLMPLVWRGGAKGVSIVLKLYRFGGAYLWIGIMMIVIQDSGSALAEALAQFVNESPYLAGVAATALALLIMLLVRKLLGVAMVVVVIAAVAAGVLVIAVGPDQARGYLEQIGEMAPELMPIQGSSGG